MQFRIADTFTASLARLTGDEQKAVKTTAFDLQMNPVHPGLQFHKLNKARDRNFGSVRVNADVRLIVHRSENNLLLCYVDHHDKAYDWAERRRLEVHPATGAAQLVEIRETVREIVVPVPAASPAAAAPKRALFAELDDLYLLRFGVPQDWLADVKAADEDSLLGLAERLPAEAAEALLQLATGERPRPPAEVAFHSASAGTDVALSLDEPADVAVPLPSPFDHPDAQRRFRVMTSLEDLKQALDAPWDQWTVFLHPEQRRIVERDYTGPARVSGSAGTGKTIVALHRAAHLARTRLDARILLATFSEPLANALRTRLRRLLGTDPRLAERIDVEALDELGPRLYRAQIGPLRLAAAAEVSDAIRTAAAQVPGHRFTQRFLEAEWEQVVDAWQLADWESYRNVARLGRKTRLSEGQRRTLWAIFEIVLAGLRSRGAVTQAGAFTALAKASGQRRAPYDHAVVDEAQDLSVAQLRFLQTFTALGPNALFFAGDLGQRTFQQPFSWKSLGVDVRGRSTTLKVNYRTSHQIRRQADRLLSSEISDVDGIGESRRDTVSVFNGPEPSIHRFDDEAAEAGFVARWLREKASSGMPAHEIALFVRGPRQIPRARQAAEESALPYQVLDERVDAGSNRLSISPMHLAKGLEFRAVVVMACDDEIVPSQERIDALGDDADLQDVYDTERHLLYVACTRARDELVITCVEPGSEFIDDLRGALGTAK